MAALCFMLFAWFGRGTDWVEGSFTVEPVVSRAVVAPWNGYLAEVHVEPGDRVVAGETVLGKLDVSDLRLELVHAEADAAQYRTEADLAWRESRNAERLIALRKAEQSEANAELLRHRLRRATLVAPLSGVVTQGDLKKELGRPVDKGQVLFEVAPLESLRGVMHVPEHRIFDVHVGQRGELATASHPGRKLPFVIERIFPVAQTVDNRQVFEVRVVPAPPEVSGAVKGHDRPGSMGKGDAPQTAAFPATIATAAVVRAEADPVADLEPARFEAGWLQPGVEGVAKADAGRERYAWLWTRQAINWVRMKVWW